MGTNITAAEGVQDVLDGVRRIVQGLHEGSRDAERRHGLTGAQLYVLRTLAQHGPLSVNELAERTFTHQSSVSTVIARLRTARLVRHRADAGDRRRRVLELTPAGRLRLDAALPPAQEPLVRAVAALSPATRRTVARALARMADAMAAGRRPDMFFESPRSGRRA